MNLKESNIVQEDIPGRKQTLSSRLTLNPDIETWTRLSLGHGSLRARVRTKTFCRDRMTLNTGKAAGKTIN